MAMIPRGPKAAETTAAAAAPAAAAPAAAAPAANTAAAPAATAAPAANTAPAAETPAAAAAPAATTTAVAAARPAGAVATRVSGKPRNVMEEEFKNKLPLEWNTLHRIQCNQGSFLDMENNKKSIGAEIEMELMTYQDGWQISPGSNEASAKELVRYSDDGVTTNKGEDCAEYLQAMIAAGWDKAKKTQRVLVAGVLTKCNSPELVGKLVQMDLSQTSKAKFDQHCFQVSFDVAKGLREADANLAFLKFTANPKSQGDRSWTESLVTYGTPTA